MSTFGEKTTGAEVIQRYGRYASGKTILITGASVKGLGAQNAYDLASASPPPAQIILLGRTSSKIQPVMDKIKDINPAIKTTFIPINQDSLSSIREAAGQITSHLKSTTGKLDIMINNAGIMAVPYSKTVDGIESQFAVNHVSHFLLTKLLMPFIKAAGPEARVVNLTSDGHVIAPFRPYDYNFEKDSPAYHPWSGYGQSKTANILFTRGLAKRGIIAFAVHPGAIFGTSLTGGMEEGVFDELDAVTRAHSNGEKGFEIGTIKSIKQGSATAVLAALSPEILTGEHGNGSYMLDCRTSDVLEYAKSEEMVEKLWEVSERLVGEKFEI